MPGLYCDLRVPLLCPSYRYSAWPLLCSTSAVLYIYCARTLFWTSTVSDPLQYCGRFQVCPTSTVFGIYWTSTSTVPACNGKPLLCPTPNVHGFCCARLLQSLTSTEIDSYWSRPLLCSTSTVYDLYYGRPLLSPTSITQPLLYPTSSGKHLLCLTYLAAFYQ